MDPGAGAELHPELLRERVQRAVVGEGVGHGLARPVEEQQKAVRLVDLASAVSGEQLAGQVIVARPDLARALVSHPLGQARAPHQIRQEQGLENLSSRPGCVRDR